jgi:small nuclear ribonucleoprotein (snRNP)-like protein
MDSFTFCIAVIVIIILVVILINYFSRDSSKINPRTPSHPTSSNQSSYPSTRYPPHQPAPSSGTKPRDPNIYCPTSTTRSPSRPSINFRDLNSIANTATDLDIKDLVDALTGAPLQAALGLFQCQRCKVFYQPQSFDVIKSENAGRCVSCQSTEITNVSQRREQRGQNADVSVITLKNYREYEGRVITFEGTVHTVLTSRRGTDYAVMFEDKSWVYGFKMVVFRGGVERIGGSQFLYKLVGHKVQVRGLLIKHEKYGYQIIISERSMILGIE